MKDVLHYYIGEMLCLQSRPTYCITAGIHILTEKRSRMKSKNMQFDIKGRVVSSRKNGKHYKNNVALLDETGPSKKTELSFKSSKAYTPGSQVGLIKSGNSVFKPASGFDDPGALDDLVKEFCREIPKTEIHLHLEAIVKKKTLLEMNRLNNGRYATIKTLNDVERLFDFQKNLPDFVKAFVVIQDSLLKVENFGLLMDDLFEYMCENNIMYTEVFLAITTPIGNGLSYSEIIEGISSKIKEFEKENGPKVRFLMDLSRTFGIENAAKNLEYVLSCPNAYIIGVGLGGDEMKGPARDFTKIFDEARQAGLHVVVHAGEDAGPDKADGTNSIREALDLLHAERIGHGIAAVDDDSLIEYLRKKQVPLEICVTSNVFTERYTATYEKHPVKKLFKEGVYITVNSDDPTFFNTTISRELYYFYKYLNFPVSDLIGLVRNGINATFHPDKDKLHKEVDRFLETGKSKYARLFI